MPGRIRKESKCAIKRKEKEIEGKRRLGKERKGKERN
jgi:hypothetical protein